MFTFMKFRKLVRVIYISIIHLILIGVLWKTGFMSRLKAKWQEGDQEEITDHFRRMVTYHKRVDANVPNGAIIFIGDSLTQSLCVSSVAQPAVNYGIGSDTSAGVLKRLEYYQSIKRAKAVILAIGTNDLRFRGNDEIIENIEAIRLQIPSGTPVIISSVLPVDFEAKDNWNPPNRRNRVRELNERLKLFCIQAEHTWFVNTPSAMVDNAGNLRDDLHVGDGLHLSLKGNRIWGSALKNKIHSICSTSSQR